MRTHVCCPTSALCAFARSRRLLLRLRAILLTSCRARALRTRLLAVGTDGMSRTVVVVSGTDAAAPDVPCEAEAACGSLAASCVIVSGPARPVCMVCCPMYENLRRFNIIYHLFN